MSPMETLWVLSGFHASRTYLVPMMSSTVCMSVPVAMIPVGEAPKQGTAGKIGLYAEG